MCDEHCRDLPLDPQPVTRRGFVLASLSVLVAGCSSTSQTARSLPSPAWDKRPLPAARDAVVSTPAPTAVPGALRRRSTWAAGQPVPAMMNRMLPVQYITVHHDGMSPFTGNDERAAAGRLESIRRVHRGRGWGDIGYHYAIDRAGNVWEGRPIAWQGAHVKDHNEGNIGVVALGNFDEQQPTAAQLEALRRHLRLLMEKHRVSVQRVRTHQEWAPTACPGRSLQAYMVQARRGRALG